MKLVMKYLKPFALIVLLCIGLLFAQALCDLTLPNLMSDIVNVGIQQGGVEDSTPEAISEKGFALLSFFMNEEERQAMEDGYQLVLPQSSEADRYAASYPSVKSNAAYILTEKEEERLDRLNKLYGKSTYALMIFLQDMAAEQGTEANLAAPENGYADIDITLLYDMIPVMEQMPAGAFADAVETAEASDVMMRGQVGVTFSRLFYNELGMDLDAMQSGYIWNTGLKMLGIALIAVIAAVLVGLFSSRVAATVAKRLRHDVFAKVEAFSSAEYDKFSTASLITRTTNDVQQVQMLITIGIRILCYAPIMAVGGIIFAVDKSLSLSWIIALTVAVLMGLMIITLAIAMPKFKLQQKLIDKLNLVSRESLSGMLVIRAFGNEQYEEKRFERANDDLSKTNLFVQRVMALTMPVMGLLMNVTALLIVWMGGNAIADSTLQIGDMMAFIQYAMQIIMSFLMIAMMFVFVPRATVSANRISEVLDTKLEINDKAEPKRLDQVKGTITFNDVSFKYNNAEEYVLEKVSFTAKPGETTAFIGSTGSGKSTLINLIPRFYDVTEGSIELDGVDIRDVPQEQLRQNIGYIPQKGMLFSGTVATNLKYGKEDATEEEMRKAIEVAQAENFVFTEGDGTGMPISQGATNVSGGQKQRLSIARALMKNAPVYIFDDSFSALDFKTDAALRKALTGYTNNATVLIVAQRVSTIMHAEQIIVLDKGRVVGKGTHSELLQNCPEYREIAESQMQKEELA